ncbi:MAG: DUF2784 domain-containing protein [Candidatus Puniceispirillales bacterium]
MFYHVAAEVIVVIHFLFICFVVAGGFLVLRWRWLAWIHLPVVAWGALVELMSWVCPLTPLENWLRRAAGGQGYEGGYIEHYLLPIIYPAGLTHEIQIMLGLFVIAINLIIYSFVIRRYINEKKAIT